MNFGSRHIYTLKKPASWYGEMWREALPVGNGLTGALISGAIAQESIIFNRHDLWHGGSDTELPDISDTFRKMREYIDSGNYTDANQDNFMTALQEKGYCAEVETPYPHGYFDIDLVFDGMFHSYRRGVNMRTGEAFVHFTVNGCTYQRQLFISRQSDIAVLRMSADALFTAEYGFHLFGGNGDEVITENSIKATSCDGDTAVNILFLGNFTSSVKNDRLSVTGQDYTVLIRCSSHGSPLELNDFRNETYESLLEKHTAVYTPLYDSVTMELAQDEDFLQSNEQMLENAYDRCACPALLERLWRFGRYLFISAASEKGNPVPLYGIWHGGDNLMWSQYVANENVQITYWHAMAGGLSYAVEPLLRYYTSKTEKLRECARKLFGMNGIWVCAYTTPNVSGVSIPVTVIGNWISCAGWLCRHFWELYLYSGDNKLLREQILPFMYETALFYRDYAVDDGDTIRLYPSVSPENTPNNLMSLPTRATYGHQCPAVQNSTMDFAIMKELLTNLLKGIELTGMYADEADSFRALIEKIPPYRINEDGAVKEWLCDDLEDNYHHRHLSHIYPVFPGTEVTKHSDPELFEAFRTAVKLRKLGSQTGWSLAHMASIYARFGDGESSAECLDIMAKSVLLNSLFTLHNDWRKMGMTSSWEGAPVQLDAAFGTVNALQEMLFCYFPSALSVLPALPRRLERGSVRGLVFPEGKIDITWEKDGKVNVTVYAKKEIDTALLLEGNQVGHIKLSSGQSTTLSLFR